MVDYNDRSDDIAHQGREHELRESVELLFFGYRAFTAGPDAMLAKRGLGRVHHRILYFIGREPGLMVTQLLDVLAVSKQALNAPLRDLTSAKLVVSNPCTEDKRVRRLSLTATGRSLEARLTGIQTKLLSELFEETGAGVEDNWRAVMRKLKGLD